MLLNPLSLEMLPPQAIVLAGDVMLLSLAGGAEAEQRLSAGRSPPFGTVALDGPLGRIQVAAARCHDEPGAEEELGEMIGRPGHAYQDFDLSSTPIVLGTDVSVIADELDLPSRRRLLGFLLGFCRKAFDLTHDADFARACQKLAQSCVLNPSVATPVAKLSDHWTLLRGPKARGETSLYGVSGAGVRRLTPIAIDDVAADIAVEAPLAGELLIAMRDPPELWTVAAVAQGLPDLLRPTPGVEQLRRTSLARVAAASPQIASLLREQALFAPATPVQHDNIASPVGAALEVALPDGSGRMFLRGWLRDPKGLVDSLHLQTMWGETRLAADQLYRFQRADVTKRFAASAFMSSDDAVGFVAHVDDPSQGLCPQPSLQLRLRSGARIGVRPPLLQPSLTAAREAVLTSVRPHEATDAMIDQCIAPAAAAFNRGLLANVGSPDLIRIGAQPANPELSIIVPLFRNLSFLRHQFDAWSNDKQVRSSELVFVLDSPEQRVEAEHLLRGLNALHELGCLLVVLPRNLGYATANNIAARHVRGRHLLLLNSDVVPCGAGWLSPMLDVLASPRVAAVGPKLLFDDGSVQHAGLLFRRDEEGTWFNAHYAKGMPRSHAAAMSPREVPAVTGAALLVNREVFEAVGGICHDYIIGDYEDSDFCLKLRQHGTSIHYVPQSELYHFERKSIGLHRGYAGTLACRLNRRLHHLRWNDEIAELMDRPEFAAGAAQ